MHLGIKKEKRLSIWLKNRILIDYQVIKYINNLIQNYKIILKELTNTCKYITASKQIRLPKMSDLELVALNLTAEYMSINSELQLFRCISGTELEGRIERSVYNRRKRKLFPYIEKNQRNLEQQVFGFHRCLYCGFHANWNL